MKVLKQTALLTFGLSLLASCGQYKQRQTSVEVSHQKMSSSDAVVDEARARDIDEHELEFGDSLINEEEFNRQVAEGELIFSADVIKALREKSEQNEKKSITDDVIKARKNIGIDPREVVADQPMKPGLGEAEETDDASTSTDDIQAGKPVEDETDRERQERERVYQESLALASNEIDMKIDGMLPLGAPLFMKSKIKSEAQALLVCFDDCDEKAKKIISTSYAMSRYLNNRGVNLTSPDINEAVVIGGKLVSDVAFIILEATNPKPDPANILILVEIFIKDLSDLIKVFL